jgi:hypothetical protein
MLRDHIVKHSAVEPGSTILGMEITERRFYEIYSLSAEVEIGRPRLSRLLKKLGLAPADATEIEIGTMVFDVTTTVPLIEAFKTAVPLRDVPAYLGASKRQVETLYRVGILKPLTPRTGRGSVRHVVFGRLHLDEILRQLLVFPELDVATRSNYASITFACQHGAGPFEDIFLKVLSGKIDCMRDPKSQELGQSMSR